MTSWERSHKALQALCHLLPNFQKKIDEDNPEELSEYYSKVLTQPLLQFLLYLNLNFTAPDWCEQRTQRRPQPDPGVPG